MKVGPSSASTAIWWCHTVRTQVGLLEPLPSQTSPKRYQIYGRRGSPDHSSSPKFPTSVPRLQPTTSFLSRLSGSTRRKCLTAPRLPSSTAWNMSLPRDTSPTPWELLEGARLVNRDTQIATPSRTGKPEIKKPSWNLQHCMDFVLFLAWGWGWQSRSRDARFPMHRTLEKKAWEKNVTKLIQRKATCSPLSEFNNLRSWQFFAAALSASTGKNANCFAENCFAKF